MSAPPEAVCLVCGVVPWSGAYFCSACCLGWQLSPELASLPSVPEDGLDAPYIAAVHAYARRVRGEVLT